MSELLRHKVLEFPTEKWLTEKGIDKEPLMSTLQEFLFKTFPETVGGPGVAGILASTDRYGRHHLWIITSWVGLRLPGEGSNKDQKQVDERIEVLSDRLDETKLRWSGITPHLVFKSSDEEKLPKLEELESTLRLEAAEQKNHRELEDWLFVGVASIPDPSKSSQGF